MFSEIESINEFQLLERKIDESNKCKENLENELNEFRNDVKILLEEISQLSAKLKKQSIFDKGYEEHTVEKASADITNKKDSLKLNKIILLSFENLKNEFEFMQKNYRVFKEKELKESTLKEDKEMGILYEKLVLNNIYIDELNNHMFQCGSESRLAEVQYVMENGDQSLQHNVNHKQLDSIINVINLFILKLKSINLEPV